MYTKHLSSKATTSSSTTQPTAKRPRIDYSFKLAIPDSDSDDEDGIESSQRVDKEIADEINLFYSRKISIDDDLDPLKFYLEHQTTYPHLSRLCKMLFSIQASSVPSESLFSKTGKITRDDRNRLRPELVESLIFLKENMKFV